MKLYGELVSVATRVPSTRNSTRCTAPPGSLAFAARLTLVVPAGNCWLLVGAVIDTVGGVLVVPPVTANVTELLALSAGEPLSYAVACAVWLPTASVEGLNVVPYGELVSVATRVPSMRNSTRFTETVSLAFAENAELVTVFAIDCPLVGAVTETVGGVLVGGAPHTVPFSVNEAGGLLAPLKVPLNPTVKLCPVGMLWFHSALEEIVNSELLAGCEKATGQPFCRRCPFGKLKVRVQPFVMAGPLFLMTRLAPKPLPPTQVGQVYVTVQLGDCASAFGTPPNATSNAAQDQSRFLNERDMRFSSLKPLSTSRLPRVRAAGALPASWQRVVAHTVVRRDPPVSDRKMTRMSNAVYK